MLARTLVGLLTGLLLGGVIAGGLVFGLGQASLPFWLALGAATITGALVGLVSGKPIWQEGARIEAALKAGFGALLAGIGLWLLTRYTGLAAAQALPLGQAAWRAGEVSVLAFPMIATVLTLLFEIDNTPEPPKEGAALPAGKIRVEAEAPRGKASSAARLDEKFVADEELSADDEELVRMLDAKEKKKRLTDNAVHPP